MKTTLLASLVLATILLLGSSIAQASPWFVEPNISYVTPRDSNATYWGMPARVEYSNGQSFGLNAGRTFGSLKTYLSYDQTSFKAKQIGVQTPYGEQIQSLEEEYVSHSIGANARYTAKNGLFADIGIGRSFSDYSSWYYGCGAGISRNTARNTKLCLLVSYRITPQDIELKHKNIEQPDQVRWTLSFNKQF